MAAQTRYLLQDNVWVEHQHAACATRYRAQSDKSQQEPTREPHHTAVRGSGSRAYSARADRGPGIRASEEERIFSPFYRSAGSIGAPGTDLGLTLVRQIARQHG